MASQAKQVFYATGLSNIIWSIFLQGKHIPCNDKNQDLNLDIPETFSFATYVPTSYEEVDTDDVHVIRYDHEERMWGN